MTKKAKTTKETVENFNTRRKPLVGLFKQEKVGPFFIVKKNRDVRWGRRYSYDAANVKIRGNTVEAVKSISFSSKLSKFDFADTLIKEFPDTKISCYASYKVNDWTWVTVNKTVLAKDIKAFMKEAAKNKIDPDKLTISFYNSKTEWIPLTKEEFEAINAVREIDRVAKEKEQARIKRETEKEEKLRREREAQYEAERVERVRREKIAKELMDSQDLAMALKVLENRGLNVIVVKDGTKGI